MKILMTRLLEAERALQRHPPQSEKWRGIIESLRQGVPAPVLAHFLRSLGSGRRGVSLVRHGVCSECHIRVPSGLLPALLDPQDLHLCDHCGCYLMRDPDELPPTPPPEMPAKQGRRRRHRALAA